MTTTSLDVPNVGESITVTIDGTPRQAIVTRTVFVAPLSFVEVYWVCPETGDTGGVPVLV